MKNAKKPIMQTLKGWVAPSYPGYGKKASLAFVLGFLLGPIGIALYFRSIVDGLLVLCINMLLLFVGGDSMNVMVVTWFVAGAWGIGRVILDTRRYLALEKPALSPAPSQSSTPAPDTAPAATKPASA